LSFQTSILTDRFIATPPSFFQVAKFSTSSNLAQKSPSSKQQFKHNFQQKPDQGSKNTVWYILSGLVLMIGASYAAVPLFKIFCESQGIDVNTDFRDMDLEKLKSKLNTMKKVNNRTIQVKFVASTSADLAWNFEPCQEEIFVAPGETALAFFKAKNNSDRSIIGIGTVLL
jgi:cytochrome c oxidase assembly protein subunit 11